MADSPECRPSGRGLHPSHYAALRTEILRTGDDMSDRQLRDITDALQVQVGLRGPRGRTRMMGAWVDSDTRAFA